MNQVEDMNEELAQRVREIEEMNIQLARSNADLERFAYVASHDLQEPLRQISSFTQLLARRYSGKLDADADEFIAFIVNGTRQMQELINGVLAYSRLTKKIEPFAFVDCEVLFNEVLQSMTTSTDNLSARISYDPLPRLSGNRMQLAQLFRNLLNNAIKFHGSETPCIHVGAKKQGDQWLFSFKDNGIGIAAEFYERIFEVFQRLHGKTQYPGTGIGLAICKRVVENHGGRIWLESVQGKGTTFFFTLKEGGDKHVQY